MPNRTQKAKFRLDERRKAFDGRKLGDGYKRPGSTNPRKQS